MTPTATIDVEPHMDWAANLARRVARKYRFTPGGQEEEELVSEVYMHLVKASHKYRPELEVVVTKVGALFRGYCSRHLMTQCQREARRIRNGGTYRTRKETPGVTLSVDALSQHCLDDGTPWEPADHRTADAGYSLGGD